MAISVFHGSDTRVAYQVTPEENRAATPETFATGDLVRYMIFNEGLTFGTSVNLGSPVPRIANNRVNGPRPFQNVTSQIQLNTDGSWLVDDWLLEGAMGGDLRADGKDITATDYITVRTGSTSRSLLITFAGDFATGTFKDGLETGAIIRMNITHLSSATGTNRESIADTHKPIFENRYYYVGAINTAKTEITLHLFPNLAMNANGVAVPATALQYTAADEMAGNTGLRTAATTTHNFTTANVRITGGRIEYKYIKTEGDTKSRTVVVQRGPTESLRDTTNNFYRVMRDCYVTGYRYTIGSGGFADASGTLATGPQRDVATAVLTGADEATRPLGVINSGGNSGGQLLYADNALINDTAVTSFTYQFQSGATPFLRSGFIEPVAQSVESINFSANYNLAEQKTDPVANIINNAGGTSSFCYVQAYRGSKVLTDKVTNAGTSMWDRKLLICVIPSAFFSERGDAVRNNSVLTKGVELSAESLGIVTGSENTNGRLPRMSNTPVIISLV